MATNYRAVQIVGALKHKQATGDMDGPKDVKTKYLAMGSWHSNLAKGKPSKTLSGSTASGGDKMSKGQGGKLGGR